LELRGKTDCAYGAADCNVCVSNVKEALSKVKTNDGNLMGFNVDDDIVTGSNHWQGIFRMMSGQGQYLALTTGGSNAKAGTLRIVKIDGSSNGKLLGPNRRSHKYAPPSSDRVVWSYFSPDMKHGGGIQGVGNILGVPFDQRKSRYSPISKIVLFDVSNPESPRILKTFSRNHRASAVGLTMQSNGNYLMVLGGLDGDMGLSFLELDSSYSIVNEWSWHWDTDGLLSGPKGTCWPGSGGCGAAYQSLSLVNQCDGQVFMIGMHAKTSGGSGYDRADIIQLIPNGSRMSMRKIFESNDFKCAQWGGGAQCDFIAAGGVFVDPEGKLVLYSAEHDNDGPKGKGEREKSVKMAEFYQD